MEKFEFASPAWFAVLRDLLAVYAKRAGVGFELSICEIYTGVPRHLDLHGTGMIGWHCILKDGAVRFGDTAIPEADLRTESDYAFIVPIARKQYAPDVMAEVNDELAKGAADGRFIATGRDPSKVPPYFMELHNELALRTL